MSRKPFYVLVAISIVAASLIAANNPAKKEPVYIRPGSGEVTIGPKQVAIVRFGWLSCSKGLEQDFIDHFVMELELSQGGTLLQTVSTDQGYWVQNPADPDPRCLHINEPQVAFWQFEDLELKNPGVYTLTFNHEWTAPLADGFDANEDGFIEVYPPTVLGPREVTINVLP